MTYENVCLAYGVAIHFDLDDLKGLCETKITADTEAVFKSADFLECNRIVLSYILKLDTFSCTEVDVFHACLAWIKAKTHRNEMTPGEIRDYLGDLFYDIRFGSMSISKFATLLPSYGNLFSADEYQEIIQIHGSTEFQPRIFNQHSRQAIWNKDSIIDCSRIPKSPQSSTPLFCHLDCVSSTFSTTKPFLLGEFVHVEMKLGHRRILPIEMAITKTRDEQIVELIYKKNILIRSGPNRSIRLTETVMIKPGFKYKIQLNHLTNWCCDEFKIEMLTTDVRMHHGFNIKFYNDSESSSQASNGLITVLRINRL